MLSRLQNSVSTKPNAKLFPNGISKWLPRASQIVTSYEFKTVECRRSKKTKVKQTLDISPFFGETQPQES